jgi:hypothetical protein
MIESTNPNDIRLVVAIPSAGMVRTDFAACLAGLVANVAANAVPSRPESPIVISMDFALSSVIHGNRETLVQRALDNKMTHLMFLDDDMAFDAGILDILLGRRQPIVCTNYLIKTVARDEFVAVGLNGHRVATLESSKGIVPIAYSGFGVSLFEMEVFKKVPQPWFHPDWVAESRTYTTEDNPFYRRCREAGFKVYLDQAASKLVKHLGNSSWDWTEYQPKKAVKNG